MYYIIEYFSFQYKESQDEGGQVEEDGGHLFEGEREFYYEIISTFIQELSGDLQEVLDKCVWLGWRPEKKDFL